jgi:hypothetical protein
VHNGLIIIVPSVDRLDQQRLFGAALDALASLGEDLANKLVEVLADGSVRSRVWTAEDHDAGHISNPRWD